MAVAVQIQKKTALHVGCGSYHPLGLHPVFARDEWGELRLDIDPSVSPDIVASITDMHPIEAESVDAVYSSHNLEHLFAHEVPVALGEFHRVLRPGGFVFARVPDFQAVAKAIADGNMEGVLYQSPAGPISPIDVMWGHRASIARGNHFMAHKTGFTAASLAAKFTAAGFGVGTVDIEDLELRAIYFKSALRD